MNATAATGRILRALDTIAAALRQIDEPGVVSALPPDVQEILDNSALSHLDATGIAKLANVIDERMMG